MEALPEDIIEEILVLLPVKSLLRFNCVCSRWRDLIQSRRFIHRHYSDDNNQDRLVFPSGEYVEDRVEKRHNDRLPLPSLGANVMGPVNGVLCDVSESANIVLLNPATHKMKRVPPPPFGRRHTVDELILGFGIDTLSGDFKIVVIVVGEDEFVHVWVYNSSSDCWKRVEVVGSCSVFKSVDDYTRCLNAAFLNGVCYWVIEEDGGEGCVGILAFDMMTEKFRDIQFPEFKAWHASLAAYGDSIALMRRVGGSEYEMWVMGRQGIWSKSWTLKNDHWMWPLCLWKNKVLFWNYKHNDYNLVDESTRKVKRVKVQTPKHPMKYAPFSYKESLFWIKE